ncbi:SHOCT domain-containing protein [Arthrobacter sp. 2MCAF14]|uniref:SHOCT domain-containing protein n=1 Tax=Arthrobacter sp. 2MCAF14 TaxID=3232982 RepID=UPI003F91E952
MAVRKGQRQYSARRFHSRNPFRLISWKASCDKPDRGRYRRASCWSRCWTDQLAQLAELRDSGVVTSEEFEAKKAELLERLLSQRRKTTRSGATQAPPALSSPGLSRRPRMAGRPSTPNTGCSPPWTWPGLSRACTMHTRSPPAGWPVSGLLVLLAAG